MTLVFLHSCRVGGPPHGCGLATRLIFSVTLRDRREVGGGRPASTMLNRCFGGLSRRPSHLRHRPLEGRPRLILHPIADLGDMDLNFFGLLGELRELIELLLLSGRNHFFADLVEMLIQCLALRIVLTITVSKSVGFALERFRTLE